MSGLVSRTVRPATSMLTADPPVGPGRRGAPSHPRHVATIGHRGANHGRARRGHRPRATSTGVLSSASRYVLPHPANHHELADKVAVTPRAASRRTGRAAAAPCRRPTRTATRPSGRSPPLRPHVRPASLHAARTFAHGPAAQPMRAEPVDVRADVRPQQEAGRRRRPGSASSGAARWRRGSPPGRDQTWRRARRPSSSAAAPHRAHPQPPIDRLRDRGAEPGSTGGAGRHRRRRQAPRHGRRDALGNEMHAPGNDEPRPHGDRPARVQQGCSGRRRRRRRPVPSYGEDHGC